MPDWNSHERRLEERLRCLREAVQDFLDSCPDGIERYNPKMADLIAAMKRTE